MPLNPKKHMVLSALYNFRCLSFDQIYSLVFPGMSEKTCKNTLSEMINKDKYIEKEGYHNKYAYYMLLSGGIRVLRNYGVIPLSSPDISRHIPVLSAANIRMKSNNASHQLSLNQFVIDFTKRYPELEFEYFDEKYISPIFSGIRPDGIIKTDRCLLFLEMDMNTERPSRLQQKWESYHNFIHSEDFYNTCTQDIKVLFILENTGEGSRRKYLLQDYIDKYIRPDISSSFNLYVDKKEDLFDTLDSFLESSIFSTREFLESRGFTVADGTFPDTPMQEFSFMYSIKSDDMGEFIVDDYSDSNMYTYKKVISYPKFNSLYNSVSGHDLKYLVITRNIHEAYELIKQTNSYSSGIYFTTMERLRDFTFNTALFSIAENGILYHFDDGDIRVKREENYINAFF